MRRVDSDFAPRHRPGPLLLKASILARAVTRLYVNSERRGRIRSGMITATSMSSPPVIGMRTGGARSLRIVDLRGPAGRLEAVLNEGSPDAAFAAVVAHPHPLGGGSLHTKVVYRAMKVLNAPEWGFQFPVLRFTFRGTGRSEGEHHGAAEAGDVLAALA